MVYNIIKGDKMKNDLLNKVISNVLSESDILEIKDNVRKDKETLVTLKTFPENEYKTLTEYRTDLPTIKILNKPLGRLILHRFKISKEIQEKILGALEENGFPDYFYLDSTIYLEYKKEHGFPKLLDHKDEEVDVLFVDYQLDSNTSWPLVIEGVEYDLPNNSMVTFFGNKQNHKRPTRIFKDGQYKEILIFKFKKTKDL